MLLEHKKKAVDLFVSCTKADVTLNNLIVRGRSLDCIGDLMHVCNGHCMELYILGVLCNKEHQACTWHIRQRQATLAQESQP